MSKKTILELSDDLHAATEHLKISFQSTAHAGLESGYGYRQPSLALLSAGLEAQEEAKKSWIQRMKDFFIRLWERLKAWATKQKTLLENYRGGKAAKEYEDVLNQWRSEKGNSAKEAEAILSANLDNPRFKELASGVDTILADAAKSKEFYANSLALDGLGFHYATATNQSAISHVVVELTACGQLFDRALALHTKAVQEASQGNLQASQTIMTMTDELEKLNKKMAALVDEVANLANDDANQPNTLEQAVKALGSKPAITRLSQVPFIKDMDKAVDKVMSDGDETLKWLEAISDGADGGVAGNDHIRQIGPSTLNLLVTSPAEMSACVSKFNMILSYASPPKMGAALGKIERELVAAATGASKANTPQERAFVDEYARHRANSVVTTLLGNAS